MEIKDMNTHKLKYLDKDTLVHQMNHVTLLQLKKGSIPNEKQYTKMLDAFFAKFEGSILKEFRVDNATHVKFCQMQGTEENGFYKTHGD
eukprot:CAMPEP_0116933268 /NCGR_PEP_ID=MMETSP0467-20121206/28939_1 /TAXON_ID=283647 /ORGANISM="Mesodinium pulex, Strain SPMC105" /LENGTH=88 /DNA_ID=CAMNT_0004614123 /DNA_START=874 /DNA_END=1140 /DNA_ORIENTATION=-